MRERLRSGTLPELLLGLLALAVAAVVAAALVADAVRDVKKRRDTITVTGSAREPIEADLATWRIAVTAQDASSATAARALRRDLDAVRAFVRDGGIAEADVREPPLTVAQVSRRVAPRRFVTEYRLTQRLVISTREIDTLERLTGRVTDLLLRGLGVSVGSVTYVSTQLAEARIAALEAATANARDRAQTLVEGLGGDLGPVRRADLGVYQIVPRNSTQVSDYGINDVSSRRKDVISVVTVTFAVSE